MCVLWSSKLIPNLPIFIFSKSNSSLLNVKPLYFFTLSSLSKLAKRFVIKKPDLRNGDVFSIGCSICTSYNGSSKCHILRGSLRYA